MAQGSAMECAAAIDILRVTGHLAAADATRAKHKLTRIVQMLVGLRARSLPLGRRKPGLGPRSR